MTQRTTEVYISLRSVGLIHFLTILFLITDHVSCSGRSRSLTISKNGTMEIGEYFSISCSSNHESTLWWAKGGVNLTETNFIRSTIQKMSSATLDFSRLSYSDLSDYTCFADHDLNKTILVGVDVKLSSSRPEVVIAGGNVSFFCEVHGFPIENKTDFRWLMPHQNISSHSHTNITEFNPSAANRKSVLHITGVTKQNNGTYVCQFGELTSDIQLRVQSIPEVEFGMIKSVGKSRIFVNWTVIDGNSPISLFNLTYKNHRTGAVSVEKIEPHKNWCVLNDLNMDSLYSNFTIIVENGIGRSEAYSKIALTTLATDPTFVPTITLKGSTSKSVSLGWDYTQSMSEYYHNYEVSVTSSDGYNASYRTGETGYMITQLEPGTNYFFRVRACSDFTLTCDMFSSQENATTMDGVSSAPRNITVKCDFNHRTQVSAVTAKWDAPEKPRGNILEYFVILEGSASFPESSGRQSLRVGSVNKTVRNTQVDFNGQPPNTKFFVRVCAKTRSRVCREFAEGQCAMPPSIPNTDELSKANWKVVQKKSRLYFMVSLPHISQRNGTICCFRVVVIRLDKMQSFQGLEPPDKLKLMSYDEVHNNTVGGAYVAEMIDPNSLPQFVSTEAGRNIMIGDENPGRDDTDLPCQKCRLDLLGDAPGSNGNYRRALTFHKSPTKLGRIHRKRHANSNFPALPAAHDGPLDVDSIYTAYLDALVISDSNEQISAQSKYFDPLRPVGPRENEESYHTIGSALIGSLVVAILVVVLAVMCVMRWRRKEPGDEEYGLSHSLQQLCRRLRGQQWVPSETTMDLPSIPLDQIIPTFVKRHKDADYEFQQEFENLPERFSDRTFHESDKRDNIGKNRYPDIKAYDQTRVRLSITEGVPCSDYINANFVVGYKERKKFICAQGPMESTVNDWWRMIWEQRVFLILMLTNTEEYNKTKCAKYWPSDGSNVFGDITVTHSAEKRFSDYLVRDLSLKRARQSENGEIIEEREVQQFHYLVWKDFMAPEHPVGIIRFIKRFNEVYSMEKGPILAHCSAGVGRTGTLVALDSLLEQLNEEKCVNIFNTICDLRHQRNYLVQSLKQYIFIYRALMEYVQFGDTEIPLSNFKTALEKLNDTSGEETSSGLQLEFEKFSHVIEDRKAISVGTSDENRHRNRHEHVIPYDRSRVILSPIPSVNKDICTYINASFIEGYDNTEEFIMAQDPLTTTVGDFWRMTVEQNVRTILMLSEVADDKCPRYWPEKDQETTHDYIRVKYMQSQSFPFYYKREFTVTNIKTEDSCLVTQFQYNGWPVGDDAVPESSRGLVELIDTTLKHQDTHDLSVGPTVVHCSDGAQRSCIFVALAILVQQLLREARVDVFSVVRKLRSQRQGLFQNFGQYELLYRGLLTYAELHMTNGIDDYRF